MMYVFLLSLLLVSTAWTSSDTAGCGPNDEGKEFQLKNFLIRCSSNGKGGIEAKTIKCIDTSVNLNLDVGAVEMIDGTIYFCELKDGNVKFNKLGPKDT